MSSFCVAYTDVGQVRGSYGLPALSQHKHIQVHKQERKLCNLRNSLLLSAIRALLLNILDRNLFDSE